MNSKLDELVEPSSNCRTPFMGKQKVIFPMFFNDVSTLLLLITAAARCSVSGHAMDRRFTNKPTRSGRGTESVTVDVEEALCETRGHGHRQRDEG